MAVLRFDFTGLGQSEGDFVETDLTTNIEDVVAAADYLRKEHRAPSILIGHSLGGAAVLGAAPRIPESVAVATIATPSDTRHLSRTLLHRAPDLLEAGEAKVDVGGKVVRVRRQLLDDLERHDLSRIVGQLGRALLIFHSPIDPVVEIDHAAALFRAARHPKSFVSVDGADHLLLQRDEDARFVGGVLAAWAERYLSEPSS